MINKPYYDKYSLVCKNCGHGWIIISDKKITGKQLAIWMADIVIEHFELFKERHGGKEHEDF